VPVLLALLAATAFAAGTVFQQRGALSTAAGGDDARFLVQLLRQRWWLAGAGLQATGWILQAAALDRGPLVVVQAITTLSLVIALPTGVWLTDQRVGSRDVIAALGVVTGIVLFITAGSPSGGASEPTASEWWSAGLIAIVLVGTFAGFGLARRGSARAATFGAAAGVCYALQAAVTKVFVAQLGHGVVHLLSTWSTYVLITSALVGFCLQQSALKTGALAPAMASSNSSTLLFSVVFGILVFDEQLTGGGQVAVALAGLLLAVVGVMVLAAQEPGTNTDVHPASG
jgi:drug/metabolite transporter (DMT)-like permease